MYKTIVSLSALVLLSGCFEEKVLDKGKVVHRNGLAYEINSNEPFTGFKTSSYANGQLEYKMKFVDGLSDGPYEFWYGNGTNQVQGSYSKGKEDGSRKIFKRDGTLDYELTYSEGVIVGYKELNGDGSIKVDVTSTDKNGTTNSKPISDKEICIKDKLSKETWYIRFDEEYYTNASNRIKDINDSKMCGKNSWDLAKTSDMKNSSSVFLSSATVQRKEKIFSPGAKYFWIKSDNDSDSAPYAVNSYQRPFKSTNDKKRGAIYKSQS
ncbi:toxin-antitoxin system YwqK family antitoxin [Motiliproteus sediminis]|uniref:toxin-antitoxin system YwqK family antitoxin n=1 Tax=Motiliproteus sediminis TaxID=1468178 RepID=UPI001AF01ECF|nr:hypothetical protein [Motiliproteus sediminis]